MLISPLKEGTRRTHVQDTSSSKRLKISQDHEMSINNNNLKKTVSALEYFG